MQEMAAQLQMGPPLLELPLPPPFWEIPPPPPPVLGYAPEIAQMAEDFIHAILAVEEFMHAMLGPPGG